jgi:hypothetical protein
MRRWMLLFFGLALLLCAMAPAIEPLDRWDHTETIAADTEFHVMAFSVGVGLAALILLVSQRLLVALRLSMMIELASTVFGVVFVKGAETACANGPPVSSPLRI